MREGGREVLIEEDCMEEEEGAGEVMGRVGRAIEEEGVVDRRVYS